MGFFYAWRNLIARSQTNLITVLSIALFVMGGTLGLAFYRSLQKMMVGTAAPENVVVLSEGSPGEDEGDIALEDVKTLMTLDGAKRDANGPLIAAEVVQGLDLVRNFKEHEEPPLLRGIDDRSIAVHGVQVIQGAPPQPKSMEIMLGRRLARRYPSLQIGTEIALPRGTLRVVGLFSANNGPHEDEGWLPKESLETLVKEPRTSSVTIVANSEARVPALVEQINSSKQIEARATPLTKLRETSASLNQIGKTVLTMLILLAIVASFAITTTMSAAVTRRIPQYAALAAIGIRKSVLARGVLLESALLAVIGGALGAGIGELVRAQLGTITLGDSAVQLTPMPLVPALGVALAVVTGLLGGVAPALIVQRLSIVDKLR